MALSKRRGRAVGEKEARKVAGAQQVQGASAHCCDRRPTAARTQSRRARGRGLGALLPGSGAAEPRLAWVAG